MPSPSALTPRNGLGRLRRVRDNDSRAVLSHEHVEINDVSLTMSPLRYSLDRVKHTIRLGGKRAKMAKRADHCMTTGVDRHLDWEDGICSQ